MGEIADSFLLSMDFLKAQNCIINMQTFILTVDKTSILITKVKTEGSKNDVEIHRVSLQKRTVIPTQLDLYPFRLTDPLKISTTLKTKIFQYFKCGVTIKFCNKCRTNKLFFPKPCR